MSSKHSVTTVGKLIKKCLKEAYFLPQKPSSYSKGYRFLNVSKYRTYDCPPSSLNFDRLLYPFRHLPAAGNEIPIIMECKPPEYLQQHWRRWLPAFPPPVIKSLDEGLQDDIPIVTVAPFEVIPEEKQSVHPDILYKLQLKSSLQEVGVPCPRHMDINSVSFPCNVKADLSQGGRGNWLVKNESELFATLRQIRWVCQWRDEIVFQEYIPGVKEVPSFQFNLHKSGELFWVGTTIGGFNSSGLACISCSVDWNKQQEYRDLVYEEFTIPVKNYLHKHGYFGLVTFEVLITDHGKYLIDINPRIGGDTTHLLLAPYIASELGLKHSKVFLKNKHFNMSAEKLVEKADQSNEKGESIIVVLSTFDADKGCESYMSIFARCPEEVQHLYHQINN